MTDIRTNPLLDDTGFDDMVHHHVKLEGNEDAFFGDAEAMALCGAIRRKLPNPLEFPCCPECKRIRGGTCSFAVLE